VSVVHPLVLAATHHITGPHIDWKSMSPLVVLTVGGLLVLLAGLLRGAAARERFVPLLTIATLGVAIAFEIARFKHPALIVSGALQIDDLALVLDLIFAVSAIAAVLLSLRSSCSRSRCTSSAPPSPAAKARWSRDSSTW
jgi:NADH:ubiquinone oxidoreductase subunit 2 (subunit N)